MEKKMATKTLLILVSILFIELSLVSALDTTTPISIDTIATHNTISDCWTAIDGKVYDLTSYIGQHPGGSSLSVICGKDGTSILGAKHSLTYVSMISANQIGVLLIPDTTKPVITLIGSSPINLIVGEVYNDAGATALDNVDGDLTSSIITTNSVDTSKQGTYLVKYFVKDSSNNSQELSRTVIVSNNSVPTPTPTPNPTPNQTNSGSKPKIKLIGDKEIKLQIGSNYIDAGAIAFDKEDGNLTDKIVVINSVNTTNPGVYFVKYSVTDSNRNVAKKSRVVIVKKAKVKNDHHEEENDHHEEENDHHEEENDDKKGSDHKDEKKNNKKSSLNKKRSD